MFVNAVFLINGQSVESTKKEVLKLIDPDSVAGDGSGEIVFTKNGVLERMQLEISMKDIAFAVPTRLFAGSRVDINDPAAAALENAFDISGIEYVFLDNDVASLAARYFKVTP